MKGNRKNLDGVLNQSIKQLRQYGRQLCAKIDFYTQNVYFVDRGTQGPKNAE